MSDKEISLDSACCYCGERLLNDDGKESGPLSYGSNGLGHKQCRSFYNREEEMQICFHLSCWSIGDTITATPSIRELKRLYPKASIDVITMFPEIFKYNTDVRHALVYDPKITGRMFDRYDMFIDAWKTNAPNIPWHWTFDGVQFVANSSIRKQLPVESCEYNVPYTYVEKDNMVRKCKNNQLDLEKDKFILLHPYGAEWKTRTWDNENWKELIGRVKEAYPDYKLVCIGGSRNVKEMKNFSEFSGTIVMYNKLPILETVALMDHKNAAALITMDTAPIHMAGCTKELPVLGIFTVVNSRYRLPVRSGVKGYKFRAIDSECSCTCNLKFITERTNLDTCSRVRLYKKLLNDINNDVNYNKYQIENILLNYKLITEADLKALKPECINRLEFYYNVLVAELAKYEPLKCHPTVDKVFNEFNILMKRFNG